MQRFVCISFNLLLNIVFSVDVDIDISNLTNIQTSNYLFIKIEKEINSIYLIICHVGYNKHMNVPLISNVAATIKDPIGSCKPRHRGKYQSNIDRRSGQFGR